MFKKLFIILLSFNLFFVTLVLSGESGDEIENKTKITLEENNSNMISEDNKNVSSIKETKNNSTQVKLLKKIRNVADPFNKNLPLLIANRGLYSNADFYSLKSLSLIGILNSEKISERDVAIFEMPDKRQVVASVGQIIGKEKAVIKTINNTDILLTVNNQNILMTLSK